MPRTKKTTDVKATDKKTVKAAPAEEVKFAELVVEPDKKTESKTETKNEAVVAPAKAETKDTPKKAGRKPAVKKATPAKKEEAKTVATPVEEVKAPVKAETKEEPKKPGRKPTAKKAAAPAKAEKKAPAKAVKPVATSVLQVAGSEFDFDKVVKAVEGLKKKNEGKSLEIYIKPEDHAVYYVVNGKGGKKIDI